MLEIPLNGSIMKRILFNWGNAT